ncbi:MAG TPA: aminoglycoside phosphotransferase family protein [Rhizomicrobium sp.]|nr:aminoglycoside phosphotransferase family protein [Rhizomicrobium sp.]
MHDGEAPIDEGLVRRLIAGQFPQWTLLSLEMVRSSGTDNALFRLGSDMVVRLPRIDSAAKLIAKECRVLPMLAPHLPVAVPLPLGLGAPAEGYPYPWSVYRWLEGTNPKEGEAVAGLIDFVAALHRIDVKDAPRSPRGTPLALRDAATREALATLGIAPDIWDDALAVPAGPDTWIHGDLMPGNLLVADGRLTAVVDFGLCGLGDPACDLIAAWNLLGADARAAFRDALAVDDAMWARGRGWALSVAAIQLPYYRDRNPALAANARRTLAEVLG